MSGSIICGVDDSESAKGAARVARDLSALLGRRLVFVRVVEPGSPDEKISAIAERLERLTGSTTQVDSGAGWLVEVGHPADRLVAAAEDEDASLIVVGSTGPRSSLLGSISADVSRRAACPVVVVPLGADESVDGDRSGDLGYAIAHSAIGVNGKEAPTNTDPDARDFAGGIVRFSLGGSREGN